MYYSKKESKPRPGSGHSKVYEGIRNEYMQRVRRERLENEMPNRLPLRLSHEKLNRSTESSPPRYFHSNGPRYTMPTKSSQQRVDLPITPVKGHNENRPPTRKYTQSTPTYALPTESSQHRVDTQTRVPSSYSSSEPRPISYNQTQGASYTLKPTSFEDRLDRARYVHKTFGAMNNSSSSSASLAHPRAVQHRRLSSSSNNQSPPISRILTTQGLQGSSQILGGYTSVQKGSHSTSGTYTSQQDVMHLDTQPTHHAKSSSLGESNNHVKPAWHEYVPTHQDTRLKDDLQQVVQVRLKRALDRGIINPTQYPVLLQMLINGYSPSSVQVGHLNAAPPVNSYVLDGSSQVPQTHISNETSKTTSHGYNNYDGYSSYNHNGSSHIVHHNHMHSPS